MLVATSLMEQYSPLFFNANFCEAATRATWQAYRGELALVEGEVADAQGRRKPPVNVLKQVILLTAGDSLKLVAGSLDELQEFPYFLDKFGAALVEGSTVVLFTHGNLIRYLVTGVIGAFVGGFLLNALGVNLSIRNALAS